MFQVKYTTDMKMPFMGLLEHEHSRGKDLLATEYINQNPQKMKREQD